MENSNPVILNMISPTVITKYWGINQRMWMLFGTVRVYWLTPKILVSGFFARRTWYTPPCLMLISPRLASPSITLYDPMSILKYSDCVTSSPLARVVLYSLGPTSLTTFCSERKPTSWTIPTRPLDPSSFSGSSFSWRAVGWMDSPLTEIKRELTPPAIPSIMVSAVLLLSM